MKIQPTLRNNFTKVHFFSAWHKVVHTSSAELNRGKKASCTKMWEEKKGVRLMLDRQVVNTPPE